MGTARVECVAGCGCKPSVMDATWEREESLMQIHSFKVRRTWHPTPNGHAPRAPGSGCSWLAGGRAAHRQARAAPPPPVQITQSERCRVRVTVLAAAGQHPSGEHKARAAAARQLCLLCALFTQHSSGAPLPVRSAPQVARVYFFFPFFTTLMLLFVHPHTPQVTLMAVMVSQFPIRLEVYPTQAQELAKATG